MLPLELFYIYLSPYTAHALTIDGEVFPTLEHAYQCARYTDTAIREEIKNAKSPVLAWAISQKYKPQQMPEFKTDEHKLSVMKRLMEIKAEQHEDVREILKQSGDQTIVKHVISGPPGDGFWDDGEDGKGLNHVGRMWMEIRAHILKK